MSTALITDLIYKQHLTGDGHPERPSRLDAVLQAIEHAKLLPKVTQIEPKTAGEDDIALCHARDYIATAKRDIARGARDLSTGDTSVSAKSWEVALKAAGAVIAAVDAIAAGRVERAFCAVRPPGHHATPNRGMGFCVFNNIAVGARYAQKRHGIGRVMIADWDVHHGNGTQDIFYSDGSVFFFSTHQSPWYPGTGDAQETGEGSGVGKTLNCPFPAGSGRREILGAFRERLVKAAEDFRPDLVMISAGFDSRSGDPLGRFTLLDQDFTDLTYVMRDIASRTAKGRLISALEGGYNLSGLGSAAAAHVAALCA